ncbi:MAG: hypothetical protein HQ503_00525 [Rhodospirillales bacterium]|nr:hypothetical protein [Rhodospirillales bacterium]
MADAPERYRFVYNGIYLEQVRSYDIRRAEAPGAYTLKIAVAEEAHVNEIITELARPDVFQPWRPKIATIVLSEIDLSRLHGALKSGSFYRAKPPERSISSIEFYWTAAACIGGKFYFKAFVWPSESYQNAQFPALLGQWDSTGIPINPPRKASEFDIYGTYQYEEYKNYFQLRFDHQGLMNSKFRPNPL